LKLRNALLQNGNSALEVIYVTARGVKSFEIGDAWLEHNRSDLGPYDPVAPVLQRDNILQPWSHRISGHD
jgi:hypothetical protein